MAGAPLIVIFGAAVGADATPSPALLRRCRYGAVAALDYPGSSILCSGGARGGGPSEAAVMARELGRLGISLDRLRLDEASLDTLQNAAAAARAAKTDGARGVVACSDGYHLPRIRLLLRVLGVECIAGRRDGPAGGVAYRIAMALREMVAIPYDLMLALLHRRRLLSY
ncbi:MAG: YdcF family protein [Phenylobacterium sp.]|nr:YdcF family protein [Phenylobacterium sp.]